MNVIDKLFSTIRSKKYLVASILFSIFGVVSIYTKIDSVANTVKKVNNVIDAVSSVAKNVLKIDILTYTDKIMTIVKALGVVGCIGLVPIFALIVALWLIKFSEKTKDPYKMINVSMILSKVYFIGMFLTAVSECVVAIIASIVAIKLKLSFLGVPVLIGVFAIIFINGIFYFHLFKMASSVSKTIDTSENHLFISKQVIIFNWIIGISHFFAFSSFFAFIAGAAEGVMYILFAIIFKEYSRELADGTITASVNGTIPTRSTNSMTNRNKTNRPLPKVNTISLTDESVIDIFENDFNHLEKRYESVFNQTYESDSEISIKDIAIVKDKVDGTRFLRFNAEIKKNEFGLIPSSLILNIDLFDNQYNSLSKGKTSYGINDNSISSYAIKIPNEVTNGKIEICTIKYQGGMNKEIGSLSSFYTIDKDKYDIDLFLSNGGF